MINNISTNCLNSVNYQPSANTVGAFNTDAPIYSTNTINSPVKKENIYALNQINTQLQNPDDINMYIEVLQVFATDETEKLSPLDNELRQKKLDALLKKGVLLNKNSNDGTSVLQNLHKTLLTQRAENISGAKVAGEIIDALYDPTTITQNFGDIPNEVKSSILNNDKTLNEKDINVNASGTCVAASVEFHMANKHPAEFARWAENLTSPEVCVKQNVNLSALSKNTMDAVWLLREFGVEKTEMDFLHAKINIKPDKNALLKAKIQDKYWDKGERNILDVLFQSSLMQLGSQNTYNTLTDKRYGKFSTNDQGLIEFEKTFIESIVENHERTSVVYQNLDMDQNIIGWNCDLGIIQKHIQTSIDNGEDVIIGAVSTAQECGETGVNPNKIVNGHEMTIVDYKTDNSGNLIFICNDTDDDKSVLVEYKASELLPKIHHASYPVQIVDSLPVVNGQQ